MRTGDTRDPAGAATVETVADQRALAHAMRPYKVGGARADNAKTKPPWGHDRSDPLGLKKSYGLGERSADGR